MSKLILSAPSKYISLKSSLSIYLIADSGEDLIVKIGLILFFDALRSIHLLILRAENRALNFTALLVLDIILLTALNIYFVGFQGQGIEGIVQANLISSVTVFIITLPIILKRFRLDLLSLSHWKTLKEFALPLMPAGLFWMILEFADRKMLEFLIPNNSLHTVGIYGAGYKLGALMLLLVYAFNYAWRPYFLKAKDLGGDILVTFDADGQHRIEDINRVINPIINGESDLVIGSRFLDESKKEVPQYRKVGIKVITKITNATIKKQLTDSQSGFRAYSKKVLNELNPSELGMGISTEILIKASTKKFRISEVPIKIFYDGDTSTHNPITHGSSVIISTIKYTSLQRPLTFYGIPSVIFLLIGGIFSYLAIQYYVEVGRLSTNLTIVSATTVLIGIVLLITAILLFSLVSVVRERKD